MCGHFPTPHAAHRFSQPSGMNKRIPAEVPRRDPVRSADRALAKITPISAQWILSEKVRRELPSESRTRRRRG
jgi:hypothetical protein